MSIQKFQIKLKKLFDVEEDTLNVVVDRLRERECGYLRYITQKILKHNPVLCPSNLRDPLGNLPLPFGVYELLNLSLPRNRRLPIVTSDTIDRKLKEPVLMIADEDDEVVNINFRDVQEDGNNNVLRFIEWLDYRRPNEINRPLVLVVYSSLREQARKDRIISN